MQTLDEIKFNFLIQPENWPLTKEIYDSVSFVKQKLVKEFWEIVKSETLKKADPIGWQIKQTYSPVFGLTCSNWKDSFSVEFGKLESSTWLGVWCDSNKSSIVDAYQKIVDRLKSIDKRFTSKDVSFYPAWFSTGDDFSQLTTIDKILPSNRNDLIDKYVNILLDISRNVKPEINAMIELFNIS